MEPLFENRYYGNWKGLAEFYQRFRTGPRLRVMIPSVLIYVGLIMFSLWKGIFDRMATPFLVLGIVYALLPLLPVFLAKTTIKNEKKQHDGVVPETVVTFGENIELHEGMAHFTIEYRKVIAVRRLRFSYALMTGKKTAVLIQENSFTKGTFEEFKAFLREKYPDMYVPE